MTAAAELATIPGLAVDDGKGLAIPPVKVSAGHATAAPHITFCPMTSTCERATRIVRGGAAAPNLEPSDIALFTADLDSTFVTLWDTWVDKPWSEVEFDGLTRRQIYKRVLWRARFRIVTHSVEGLAADLDASAEVILERASKLPETNAEVEEIESPAEMEEQR